MDCATIPFEKVTLGLIAGSSGMLRLTRLMRTEDAREGACASAERRPPIWKDC